MAYSLGGVAIRPVINASPLILLTKVGKLSLLQLLSEEVLVPAAVVIEIQQYGAMDVTDELGILVRGTLGLVLTAKQQGTIPAARPVLEQLRSCGMYLSDRVINQALALVGE